MSEVTTTWHRSSFCADGACVEVAKLGDYIGIRDGKNPDQPFLKVPVADWKVFLGDIRSGDLGRL